MRHEKFTLHDVSTRFVLTNSSAIRLVDENFVAISRFTHCESNRLSYKILRLQVLSNLVLNVIYINWMIAAIFLWKYRLRSCTTRDLGLKMGQINEIMIIMHYRRLHATSTAAEDAEDDQSAPEEGSKEKTAIIANYFYLVEEIFEIFHRLKPKSRSKMQKIGPRSRSLISQNIVDVWILSSHSIIVVFHWLIKSEFIFRFTNGEDFHLLTSTSLQFNEIVINFFNALRDDFSARAVDGKLLGDFCIWLLNSQLIRNANVLVPRSHYCEWNFCANSPAVQFCNWNVNSERVAKNLKSAFVVFVNFDFMWDFLHFIERISSINFTCRKFLAMNTTNCLNDIFHRVLV